MGIGLNYPLLLTLYVVRRVGLGLTILKKDDTCVSLMLFEISLSTLSLVT